MVREHHSERLNQDSAQTASPASSQGSTRERIFGALGFDKLLSPTDRALHAIAARYDAPIEGNLCGGYATTVQIGGHTVSFETVVSPVGPGVIPYRWLTIETCVPTLEPLPFSRIRSGDTTAQVVGIKNGIKRLLSRVSLSNPPQEPDALGDVSLKASDRDAVATLFESDSTQALLRLRETTTLSLHPCGGETVLRLLTRNEPQNLDDVTTLLGGFLDLAMAVKESA